MIPLGKIKEVNEPVLVVAVVFWLVFSLHLGNIFFSFTKGRRVLHFFSLAVVPTCKNNARSPTGADSGRNFSFAATLIHPNESAECASRQLSGKKSSETDVLLAKFDLF